MEIGKSSPLALAKLVTGGEWHWADHLDVIDQSLVELEKGDEFRKLIVCAPPQHGKSELCTKFGTVWHLGQNPNDRGVIACYSSNFAAEWGKYTRDIFDMWAPSLWGKKLSPDSRGASQWKIDNHEGGLFTTGIGGAATGRRGNWMVLDDAIKSNAEAQSELYREKTWDWLTSTFFTRMAPDGRMIILLTRWHTDDIVARVLAGKDAHQWRVISMPAFCEDEDNDLTGRKLGEPLWPYRYDAAWLANQRERLGHYYWSALYQQNPIPLGAAMFDIQKLKYIDWIDLPEGLKWFRYWDLAISQKEESSYTASVRVARDASGNVYVADGWRDRVDYPTQKKRVLEFAHREGIGTRIGIEKKQHGMAMVQDLVPETSKMGVFLSPIDVDKDKQTRATPIAAALDAGKLFVVRGSWNQAWVDEMSVFPLGKNDDQVDATSGGWSMAKGMEFANFKFKVIDF